MSSILDKVFAAGRALKAGEELENPAVWKNQQSLMNTFMIILGSVPIFIDIDVSEAQLNAISYGFAVFAGVCNLYITNATSRKVGLPIKNKGN